MLHDRQAGNRTGSDARRARVAVVGLFLVNGMGYPSVVPWLPAIKNDLGLSNAALGGAIAAVPLGALLLGMLAGPLIARFGSARVAVAAGVAMGLVLPLVALAPSWLALAAVFFALGAADAWMDSAMNAHGLRVQRRYGRSIIVTFHAVWSVGAVTAGLLGAGAGGLSVPMLAHLGVAALLLVTLTLAAARATLPGAEHAERDDGAGTAEASGGNGRQATSSCSTGRDP